MATPMRTQAHRFFFAWPIDRVVRGLILQNARLNAQFERRAMRECVEPRRGHRARNEEMRA
jgi:hypothetical protein